MDPTLRALSDHRFVRLLDRLVVFWVVLWIVLGIATGITLWRAADLGDTVSRSGSTLSEVGASLKDLSDLPLVPDRPGEVGDEVQASAVDISAAGQEVKQELRLLGVLLGIAVIGIPVTPVVGLYLPMRLRRGRETKRLRRVLRDRPDAPGLDEWLADRARSSLPFDAVEEILQADAPDDATRQRRLAEAELRRIGLRRGTADAGSRTG